MSAKNFMSNGDAETVFTAFANAIKNIKDGSELDSFGDVEVALLDKADTSDLGTAAAKDSTNSVTSGSTDLVESGAVREAIDASVAAAYHHAGTKTVAQLTHDLLIAANAGNVYNITDSGTTTSDFIEGIGKQIDAGDNVGICKVGNIYMFDLLSGLEDTSIFVQKSQTAGLLKNDGTVNTTIEDTVAGHTTAIAGKQDKYETITYAQWQALTPEQQAAKDYYISDYPSSILTAGNIAYDNTESGMAANKVQGAIDELKSGLTRVAHNDFGHYVDISSYTSDKYTCDSDGYLLLATNATSTITAYVYSANYNDYMPVSSINGINTSVYIRKGMRLLVHDTSGTSAVARFYPLVV